MAAEEIVRNSGLDYTIIRAGVVYGRGDHMLDHLSHALYTFPFLLWSALKRRLFARWQSKTWLSFCERPSLMNE